MFKSLTPYHLFTVFCEDLSNNEVKRLLRYLKAFGYLQHINFPQLETLGGVTRHFNTFPGIFLMSINCYAGEKTADCLIESNGSTSLNGKCKFEAEGNGSFRLSNITKGKGLIGSDILSVNVYIIEKGVAEVSGSLKDHNSRWGEAKRSDTDKSCWIGSDFKICTK